MTMSARGLQLQRSLAMTLELLKEHDKLHPEEVDALLSAILTHIRSSRSHLLIHPGGLP